MRTEAYAPESNAAERVKRMVLNAIRVNLEGDHCEWDLYLPEIEFSIRNAVHQVTGETPFFTVYGHHMFFNGFS